MTDPWPRRNLGRAEHWGRVVEQRVSGLFGASERQDQSQGGLGRFSSSTAETVRQNAEALARAIMTTPYNFSDSTSATGWGFGGSWVTVASCSIPNPGGYTRADVTAVGVSTSFQTGSASARFIWPFSLNYVTSEFGPRPPLPIHNGIDFSYSGILGTPIPVTHDGTIILRATYPDWGHYTRVDCSAQTGHAGDWTGYAHMNAPGIYGVGTAVTQGQTIGYVGNTGASTGPHCHYETASGDPVTRMNPRDFMDIYGGTAVSLSAVQARIVINGVSSPVFQPFTEMGLSQNQLNYPVFGSSVTAPEALTVELQVKSSGAAIPANAGNVAQMTVRGSFSYA